MPLRASRRRPPKDGTSSVGAVASNAPATPQPSHPTIATVATAVVMRPAMLSRFLSANADCADIRFRRARRGRTSARAAPRAARYVRRSAERRARCSLPMRTNPTASDTTRRTPVVREAVAEHLRAAAGAAARVVRRRMLRADAGRCPRAPTCPSGSPRRGRVRRRPGSAPAGSTRHSRCASTTMFVEKTPSVRRWREAVAVCVAMRRREPDTALVLILGPAMTSTTVRCRCALAFSSPTASSAPWSPPCAASPPRATRSPRPRAATRPPRSGHATARAGSTHRAPAPTAVKPSSRSWAPSSQRDALRGRRSPDRTRRCARSRATATHSSR